MSVCLSRCVPVRVCVVQGEGNLAPTYEHHPLHLPTLPDLQTRVRSYRRHGNSSSSCGQWRTSRTGLETWRARWHQRTSAGTSSPSITSSRSMLYVSLSAVSLSVFLSVFCLLFFVSVSLFCLSVCLSVCLSPCQTISFNSMKTQKYSFYLSFISPLHVPSSHHTQLHLHIMYAQPTYIYYFTWAYVGCKVKKVDVLLFFSSSGNWWDLNL